MAPQQLMRGTHPPVLSAQLLPQGARVATSGLRSLEVRQHLPAKPAAVTVPLKLQSHRRSSSAGAGTNMLIDRQQGTQYTDVGCKWFIRTRTYVQCLKDGSDPKAAWTTELEGIHSIAAPFIIVCRHACRT